MFEPSEKRELPVLPGGILDWVSRETITLISKWIQAEFDRFADEYHDQHRANVAVTGEGPEYFAEYKIRKLKQIVDRSRIALAESATSAPGSATRFPSFGRIFRTLR